MICITEHQRFGQRVSYMYEDLSAAQLVAQRLTEAGINARITVQDDDTGELIYKGSYRDWNNR